MDYVSLIVIFALLTGLYIWYASIISRRNNAREALSGIDVQLRKRSNLIPNILAITKRFMEHENELFSRVIKLRTRVDKNYDPVDPESVHRHLQAAGALGGSMSQLMIAVEGYPELKSDATLLQAQRTYNEVEAQISAARRFYNVSVTRLNNSIEIFPGNLIAAPAKARAMPFYEADEVSIAPVNANSFLN